MKRQPQERRLSLGDGSGRDFIPGWYAVISSRELRGRRPLAVERFGLGWVIYRHEGGVSAMLDRCPHRAVALSAGVVRGDRIQCPFHGFEFGPDGVCQHIPAHGEGGHIPKTMQAKAVPAREAHDFVWLWWGPVPSELPAIDWFEEELSGCFGPHEFWRDSEVGISRNIENQLDFTHLPFVHARTIGRFVKSPMMEVDVAVDGQRIRAFRRGQPEQFVEMRLPNVWVNKIGPRSYVTLAFSPIDEARTRLYLRYYQGSMRIPLLRGLLGWLMCQSNKWIIAEDLRVIDTHNRSVSPPLDGSEALIPSDAPIIAYRRLRDSANTAFTPE